MKNEMSHFVPSYLHCVKYRSFTEFPVVENLCKGCVIPQIFHTKKLGKITAFCAVPTCQFGVTSTYIQCQIYILTLITAGPHSSHIIFFLVGWVGILTAGPHSSHIIFFLVGWVGILAVEVK